MSGKTTDTDFNIEGVDLQGLDTPQNQPGGFIEQALTVTLDGFEEAIKIARNEAFENDESIPYEMTFPAVLNSIENIRPVLQIKCVGGPNNGKEVIFPCPVGFAVSDGASYNDVELGQFGQSAKNITQNLLGSEKSGTPASQIFAEAYANDNNSMGSKIGQGIAGALLTGLGLGKEYIPTDALKNVATGIGMALGITVNKNNTTEFTGIGTRSFSFQYKLVPSNRAEGEVIDQITRFFRQGIYPMKEPSTGGIILRYPPRWELRFLRKIGGDRIPSVPAIAECYLESFATSYNGSNSFHDDGAPVDTDITLSFKESRSLTRDDIKRLENNGNLRD